MRCGAGTSRLVGGGGQGRARRTSRWILFQVSNQRLLRGVERQRRAEMADLRGLDLVAHDAEPAAIGGFVRRGDLHDRVRRRIGEGCGGDQ